MAGDNRKRDIDTVDRKGGERSVPWERENARIPAEPGFRTLENRGVGWDAGRIAIRATAVLHNDLRVKHPRERSSVRTGTQKQGV
jgi:hypothetical protein